MKINTNIQAMSAARNYRINTKDKAESAEKLSSGYSINRAADDAANLTISEKMRAQIRALNKGTQNAQSGVSWIHVGEAALGSIQDMIHRMSEITIQSLNDTNTDLDRAALQAEFDHLQSEIDKVSDTTMFNTKNIFADHEPSFYQFEGNVHWNQGARHTLDSSMNTLTVSYIKDNTGNAQQLTITVPEGTYTTQELIDEIDDAMKASGGSDAGINLEYTQDGTCNINIEDGKKIESISGGLSYLINDMYTGGSVGALIGTTTFVSDDATLAISSGKNDELSFQVQDFSGNTQTVNIRIPAGRYTRTGLINMLNNSMSGTGVEAVKYGKSIKLQSDTAIITGFKGNMFKIDTDPGDIHTSVFYDNVQYGTTKLSEAVFTGGAVITSSQTDEAHNHYTIDGSNDKLTLAIDGGTSVTLNIDHGRYTVSDMADKLNVLMIAAGLKAGAYAYTSGGYGGIKIMSGSRGLNSAIEIDGNSSAYDTLFCRKEYNRTDARASVSYETRADSTPTLTGGRNFDSSTLPLTVANWKNDRFTLSLNGASYNITIGSGTYNSAAEVAAAINDALNGSNASVAYKGRVNVSADAVGRIILSGNAGSGLENINVSGTGNNDGYKDIWVGTKVEYRQVTASGSGTADTPAKITLNTPVDNPADLADSSFTVDINGNRHTVKIPSGVNSKDDIIDAINDQLKEEKIITINKFPTINASGTTSNNTVTASGTGTTSTTSGNYTSIGVTQESQGVVGAYDVNKPASITLDRKIGTTNIVNSSNNKLTLNVTTQNGTSTVNITIPDGSYSGSGLVTAIQKQLDNKLGSGYGGVKVGLENGALSFTSRLNDASGNEKRADETGLRISTADSSFLRELYTTRTPAHATSGKILEDKITINDDNNEFVFTYRDGAGTRNIKLTLSSGTYDRNGIVNEINRQLAASKTAVKASLYNNRLRLTSDGAGNDYMISYSNTQGGNSAESLFGDFVVKKAASATAQCDMQDKIDITDDTSGFIITVNGNTYNITLDTGSYDRQSFTDMLNEKLADNGVPVTASLSGKRLTYTTNDAGSSAGIFMSYDGGGSSMFRIYGQTVTVKPGAKASFNSNGQLELTGTGNGGSLSVSSGSGGGLQKQEKIESDINPAAKSGYVSGKTAYIDGVGISEPVTINEWNRKLSFDYKKAGVSRTVDITLEDGTYDYAALAQKLRDKLDASAGAGELAVTVDASGVRIESTHTGSSYAMTDFSGGFYQNVLCKSTEVSQNISPSNKPGGQICDAAFTVGRKNIRNSEITVEKDLNDEFTFDISYGSKSETISVKLDEGKYSGNSLVSELQNKINDKLAGLGLSADMVKAQIGGVNTGVVGANDNDALCLKINDNAVLAEQGQYIIDGVRGSAAFNIFYQTDGKMIPAYTAGAKDLTEGVEITADNNTLSLDADGVTYSVTIPDGNYTPEELAEAVNNGFNAAGAPLTAKIEDGRLRIQYNSFGKHMIDNVAGSAKDSLFYVKNSADGDKENIKIQLSGNTRDYVELDRPVINTVSLGINSVAITKPKYANKALGKLADALDRVSEVRSDYGAMENRLEHAINGNNNTAENTQSAESLVRDTDIASETVRYAADSILQQAAQAMIAQANVQAQGVLKLLG